MLIINIRFQIGTSGTWNDTAFPRVRVLEESHGARWEFTEAEILSGLDSYFISKHIREWVNQLRRLRLSQVVEMYYHARGVPVRAIETSGHKSKSFGNMQDYATILEELNDGISLDDDISSACHRMKILESIDIGRLQEETSNLAQVLQYTATSVYMAEEKLRSSCDQAVNMFLTKAKTILGAQTQCNNIPKTPRESVLDLQVVIDGSRSEYENLQLVNHLAHISQVSSYGTNITVIHGTTGEIISSRTSSVVETFEQMRNYTGRSELKVIISRKF